jgi:hypothetical protein
LAAFFISYLRVLRELELILFASRVCFLFLFLERVGEEERVRESWRELVGEGLGIKVLSKKSIS